MGSPRYYREISPSICPVCPTTLNCGINVIASCLVRQSSSVAGELMRLSLLQEDSSVYLRDRDCITSMFNSMAKSWAISWGSWKQVLLHGGITVYFPSILYRFIHTSSSNSSLPFLNSFIST